MPLLLQKVTDLFMNEWEFTADFAGWINEILGVKPDLPFSQAKCEQQDAGGLQRRDITLLDKNQRVILTGEVKLPFRKEGSSPYNSPLVSDAQSKALSAGSPFFFTWNVNKFVLWETKSSAISWQDHDYRSWDVVSIYREHHLELASTVTGIKNWLLLFLNEFARIVRGDSVIWVKLPDEKFVEALEASLHIPILLNTDGLEEYYRQPRFKSQLDKWMREEQGWIIYSDPQGIRDNLERASQFACYALVCKLVFYEALLKRYSREIEKITVPDHIETGDALRLHLEGYFAQAKNATRDYETVFGEDHTSIGSRIPFYSDIAVPYWRNLSNQIHQFDFSGLDYEIIGSIFERLNSPEERHKFGQFYTRVEVVDLINSFCIRRGDEKVMDPACGGGTFLVRAYIRKRELQPHRRHKALLSDLFGMDIANFATHLTTINLATRDLIAEENYPQIGRNDFFDVNARKAFVRLPKKLKSKGLGKTLFREIEIPLLDAVVGNPPYIRQEDIPKNPKNGNNCPESGTKEYYANVVKSESHVELSGRSDIHCYFWPHAASFLKNDGYICFLTSSQWLDVEYGFRLQEWILLNFEIIAVFESIDEPWFVGARVTTAITILRRQQEEKKRMNNIVRFVQLRRPIREILAHDGTSAGAVVAANLFRDEILSLEKNTVTEYYRTRLVRQEDLWKQGCELGDSIGKSGSYYGGKWGNYLRVPDFWFQLIDDYGAKFTPLSNIAAVRRGITSGKDVFFFPKDYSSQALEKYPNKQQFMNAYGVPRREVESGKVKLVLCGEGYKDIRPIESEFLEPEIHSLMEIDSFTVSPEDCDRLILFVSEKKSRLRGKYVLSYINWGEKQDFHTDPTCTGRITDEREWYDLSGHCRAPVLWPKERQYRHIAPVNPRQLIANCRLYEIYPPKEYDQPDLWGGILNSTWVILSSFQFGRPVGNEGNWSTMVADVKMMLVPDPTKVTKKKSDKVTEAFQQLKKRKALSFLSERRLREMAYRQAGEEDELDNLSDTCELDMPDRRELDDAVLEMLGIRSKVQRQQMIDELYDYLRNFFEQIRQKEEKAIANKKKGKKQSAMRPNEIAAMVYEEIAEKHGRLLRRYDPEFIDKSKPFDTYDIPSEGDPVPFRDLFKSQGVQFRKGKKAHIAFIKTANPAQADLIILVVKSGLRGLIRIPHEEEECFNILKEYENFVKFRDERIPELIAERTADEAFQDKIYDALMPLLIYGKR